MAAILNNTVWVVQALLAMFLAFVFLGNFFKKKSLLASIGMYGEGEVMVATGIAFVLCFWIGTTFMYAYNDPRHESFHLGSLIFMGMLAFGFCAVIMYALVKWQKSIPET